MRSRTEDLKRQQLNDKQWQKHYYHHQQSYLRARLLAIKFLSEGKTRTEAAQLVNTQVHPSYVISRKTQCNEESK